MANSFGTKIKVEGESEYRKALNDITAQLKVVSSEMVKVTAEYGKNNNSVEATTKKSAVLSERLEAQKEKVDTLRQALEKSKETYGETDARTLKWQASLNNAEADVIKTTKEIDSLGNELQDSGKQAETSANGGYTVFKNVLANLATDAIESALAGIKKLGGAIVDVGKQALTGYADYEQLVGGVETLFGESAGVVQNYANNAYKTAGLSANAYMETVTSFSASLLQSLNGDTAKSAEVADMAITDMADNANKMGTSMESIQNAYQGFAKQNYTMLDNLKLGYGGTKTEMERLLADAEKFSGVHYDIKNLNDVYSAIHVVQQEMGITGTTAKEASETISGSMSSMQSAWQNLLVGLADGDANIQDLITNLVDSVLTAVDNILPIIDEIASKIFEVLPQILTTIQEQLPNLLQTGMQILTSLIQGIVTAIPQLVPTIVEIINTLVTNLIQMLPMIIQAGIDILLGLIQGLTQMLPDLIPVMIDAVVTIVETLLDNIDLIIDAGIQLILALADGLLEALPRLIDKIPVIIDKLITAITNNLPKIIQMGIELTVKLAVGLIKAIPQLVSKIPQIITSIVKGLTQGLGQMAEVGLNLVKGLWNGINNAKNWVLDKIKGFGKAILNGIKSFFGIHSPSTLFRDEIGDNLAKGVGLGFSDTMDDVAKDMANSIPTEFDTNVQLNSGNSVSSVAGINYDYLVGALKDALSDVKVVMNDKEMGTFVTDTIERAVYS